MHGKSPFSFLFTKLDIKSFHFEKPKSIYSKTEYMHKNLSFFSYNKNSIELFI